MPKPIVFLLSTLLVPLPVAAQAQPDVATAPSGPGGNELCREDRQVDAGSVPTSWTLLARTGEEPVRIRWAHPTPWLAGLPGWAVAETRSGECYRIVDAVVIHAFGSTDAWAKIEEFTGSDADRKSGWIQWGESFDEFNESFVPAFPMVGGSPDR